MSERKHTKGPWRLEGQYVWAESVGGCTMTESEHMIATVRGWGHLQYRDDGAEVQDANGRLIAAAPDLLAELEDAVEEIADLYRAYCVWLTEEEIEERISTSRAAIAKAIGEEVSP